MMVVACKHRHSIPPKIIRASLQNPKVLNKAFITKGYTNQLMVDSISPIARQEKDGAPAPFYKRGKVISDKKRRKKLRFL